MKIYAVILAMASMAAVPSKKAFLSTGGLDLSQEGYQLILNHEVGGGAAYYNRALCRPTWPGGASGVTIGVGYDLGYNTRAQIAKDWHMLSPDVIARLQSCAGIKGLAAKRKLGTVRDLVIPWDYAREVFNNYTLPRFAKETRRAYPQTETLHHHVQSAMLSWTFNRGGGISETSNRDLEKRLIRRDIPDRPWQLPAHFRSSKRLWEGKGLPGLLRRREDEATLIEAATRHDTARPH